MKHFTLMLFFIVCCSIMNAQQLSNSLGASSLDELPALFVDVPTNVFNYEWQGNWREGIEGNKLLSYGNYIRLSEPELESQDKTDRIANIFIGYYGDKDRNIRSEPVHFPTMSNGIDGTNNTYDYSIMPRMHYRMVMRLPRLVSSKR